MEPKQELQWKVWVKDPEQQVSVVSMVSVFRIVVCVVVYTSYIWALGPVGPKLKIDTGFLCG